VLLSRSSLFIIYNHLFSGDSGIAIPQPDRHLISAPYDLTFFGTKRSTPLVHTLFTNMENEEPSPCTSMCAHACGSRSLVAGCSARRSAEPIGSYTICSCDCIWNALVS
jgi:hypothetical protein